MSAKEMPGAGTPGLTQEGINVNTSIVHGAGSPFESIRRTRSDGSEFWSARDLMPLMGYEKWERFEDAIERARASVANSGQDADQNASRLREPIGKTQRTDFYLSRFAAYLVAMNGDPRKAEVAAAQAYFAIQTRRQELANDPVLPQNYVEALEALLVRERANQALTVENAELVPRATAWDAIASAVGDYSVGDAAKILSRAGIPTGPQRLFAQLEDIRWVYRGMDGKWRAYAERVEKGFLAEKAQFHHHPATGELVLDAPQVRVTVKGVDKLRQRLHVGALTAVTA